MQKKKNKIAFWFGCLIVLFVHPVAAGVNIQEVEAKDVTAWMVEAYHVPIVEVAFTFKNAGAVSDPKNKQGLARIVSKMLMEGTKSKDATQLREALESLAIHVRTSTSGDMFTVSMLTLAENLDEAFDLFAEVLNEPRFGEAKLDEVKERTKIRIKKLQEKPHYVAGRGWDRLAYGDHPYGQSSHGTPETIANITVDDLKRFHGQYLTRENLLVAAVGAVDAKIFQKHMADVVEPLPKAFKPAHDVKPVTIDSTGKWKDIERDLPQSVVIFGVQGIPRDDPDFYAAYVMNHIVGGMSLTSRLGKAVRKEKGLTYDISTALDSSLYSDVWYGVFATKSESVMEALKTAEEAIRDAGTGNFTEKEVKEAIGYLVGSFPLNLGSNSSVLRYLQTMQIHGLGKDYLEKRNDLFKAVTVDQVNKVAQRLLNPDKFVVVKVGVTPKKETE